MNEDEILINQFAAEMLGREATREYLEQRARRADRICWSASANAFPTCPPKPADELPEA